MWLWESPTRHLGFYAVYFDGRPTEANNLRAWWQLPLILRQGSVETDLYSNGGTTGTPSNPGKISLGLQLDPSCPPSTARKQIQDWVVGGGGADFR